MVEIHEAHDQFIKRGCIHNMELSADDVWNASKFKPFLGTSPNKCSEARNTCRQTRECLDQIGEETAHSSMMSATFDSRPELSSRLQ
jgi:hypothetical protein